MTLPSDPGTYLLRLPCPRPLTLRLRGRAVELAPGWYFYVGSAFGPGGLAARLAHHLRPSARPHWHIDHLRRHLVPDAVWVCRGQRRLEHDWAARLQQQADGQVAGFGASDCRCASHLFHFVREPRGARLGTPHGPPAARIRLDLDDGVRDR